MSSAARIEELQKKFDENPRRYFAPLANECRKAGDLDAAIAICRTHLPQQPGHMSGHIVYGQALFESGELDEARTVFETALGLDPENLIALRHMGDIAARYGDLGAARQWYMRVLETDPRNEEIQSLVAGLGEEEPRVRGGLPTLVDPALLAAAADAMPDGEVPEDGDHHAAEPEAFEPELLDFDEPRFAPAPLATTELEAAAAADTPRDELLEPTAMEFEPPTDAGTLEGLEATTFEPPPAGEAAAFERIGDEALMDDIDTTASQLEGLESAEFDASGYGGSGLETIAAPSFDFEPADASPLQDPPAVPDARPSGEAFVTETMAELYLRQGYRDEALGVYRKLVSQSPDDGALRSRMERLEREIAEEAGGDTPLAPDAMEADGDDFLAGLPRAMEPALVAAAAEAGAGGGGSTAGVQAGPTIREFLAALASGSVLSSQQPAGEIADVVDLGEFEIEGQGYDGANSRAEASASVGEPEVPDAGFEPFEPEPAFEPLGEDAALEPVAPDAAFEPLEPETTTSGLEPVSQEPEAAAEHPGTDRSAPAPSQGGGLDSLFGAPQANDARAADALAAAFLPQAEQAETAPAEPVADPLRGRPARPAGNDLSLDSVFGAPRQQGSQRNTGGFSFDQFFAEGAVKPAREDAPDQPGAAGDEEDLEQFNSWLHNLRKQ